MSKKRRRKITLRRVRKAKMKILLTGSSGFIGKAYLAEMEKAGHEIIPFDLPDDDILRDDDLVIAISKADIVFHMAAVADLYQSAEMPDKNFEVNVRGTYNVAKYCNRLDRGLIFCSTCCVYGNCRDIPAMEDKTLPACCELYATSKIAGERMYRPTMAKLEGASDTLGFSIRSLT